jgi:hypothetical protein
MCERPDLAGEFRATGMERFAQIHFDLGPRVIQVALKFLF